MLPPGAIMPMLASQAIICMYANVAIRDSLGLLIRLTHLGDTTLHRKLLGPICSCST